MTAPPSSSFPNPPPPDKPPDVYLVNPERPGDRQKGILTASHWNVRGQLVTVRPDMPVQWPAPLAAPGSGVITVRIATKSPPFEIEVRQFGQIGPDGGFIGAVTGISKWRHTQPSSRRTEGLERALIYDPESDLPGWDIYVPLSPSSEVSYMNVWAQWFKQRETARLGVDMYSANWKVSARRQGPAAAGSG